jgi:hypothetical protein
MTKPPEDGMAGPDIDVFVVPEQHRSAVFEGLDQSERRQFVSEEGMAALWKKCGL